MRTISLENIPVEPTVTILNPDGNELITTNSITTFTYIRLEIKKNKLKGYKVRAENGNTYNIRSNGQIYNEPKLSWPDGLTGEVHDRLLAEFIRQTHSRTFII